MVAVFRVADDHAMSVNDRIKSKKEYHIISEIDEFKLLCVAQSGVK